MIRVLEQHASPPTRPGPRHQIHNAIRTTVPTPTNWRKWQSDRRCGRIQIGDSSRAHGVANAGERHQSAQSRLLAARRVLLRRPSRTPRARSTSSRRKDAAATTRSVEASKVRARSMTCGGGARLADWRATAASPPIRLDQLPPKPARDRSRARRDN